MKQFYPRPSQFVPGFRIGNVAARIVGFFLLLLVFNCSVIAQRFAVASGNWSSTSTWSTALNGAPGASVPGPSDDVTIQTGITVTLAANAASLSLTNLGSLDISSFTLSVGNIFTNSGTFLPNTGTVIFNRTNTQNIPALTYYNLQTAGSNTKTLGGAVSVTNILTVGTGTTLALSTHTLTLSGVGTPLILGGTGAFSSGTSTVIFNAVGNQTIPALTYNNLQTSGSGIKTIAGTVLANNIVTIGLGTTLELGSQQLNLAAGSGINPLVINGTFSTSTSTVNYNGGNGTIITATNYFNLSSSNNTRTFQNSGTIGIANVFTPGNQTYTTLGSTINFNGVGNQAIPGLGTLIYENLQTSTSGTKSLGGGTTVRSVLTVGTSTILELGSQTLTLSGSGSPLVVAGTFSATTGTSTVNYTNVGSANVVALNYHNLNLSNGPRVLPNSGTVGIAGLFTPGAAAFTITGSTIHFNGSIPQTVPSFNYFNLDLTGVGTRTSSGIIGIENILSPGLVASLGGTVNFNGSNQSIPALTYATLQTVNPGIKSLIGNTTVSVVLNVNTGSTIDLGSNTLTLSGGGTPLVVNGSFLASSSTVIFSTNGTQIIPALTYFNLQTAGNNTKTLAGSTTVNNVLTLGLNTTLSLGANTLTLNGSGVPLGGTGSLSAGTSTVVYNGTAVQTIANVYTFYNLTINNTAGVTLTANPTVNAVLNLLVGNITTGSLNYVYLPSTATVNNASATSYVNGNLRKQIPNVANLSRTFEVGENQGYAPVQLNFTGTPNSGGLLTIRTTTGDHPQICTSLLDKAASVNRYYYIENGTGTIVDGWSTSNNSRVTSFTSLSATFNFYNPADIDAGANTDNFIVKRFQTSNNTWTLPTTGTKTVTSTTVTGLLSNATSFGIFQIGEPEPIIATSPQVTSLCYNNATNILMATSKVGISYQLRNNANNAPIGSPVAGTGGAISFPTGTLLTTTTFNVLATNTVSSCALLMANTSSITINPGTEKVITALPAEVCVGNSSIVRIALSQANVKYVLRNDFDNSPVSDTVKGNGTNLDLQVPIGYLSDTTTFNVWAIDTVSNCTGVLINKVTINTLDLPSPDFELTQDFCTLGGGNVILASNTMFPAYLWSTTQTSQSIQINQSGFYSLTVTDGQGCRTTKSIGIGDEKVLNGDFEMGIGIGYTSGHIPVTAAGALNGANEGKYAVGPNPTFYHGNFYGRDHTTGTGNLMIINSKSGISIWETTVNVVPNTRYYFSAWALSLNNVGPFAQLQFRINDTLAGTSPVIPAGVNLPSNAGWQRFFGTWDSGPISGPIPIKIVNLQGAAGGNDFGIDDVSFSTLPPVTFFGASVGNGGNNLCIGDTLKLTATLTGGANPITYSWTGPGGFTSTQEDPVILNAEGGWYYLTAVEGRNCQSKDSIFIILSNPIVTGVAQPGKCFGAVKIAVSGMVPNSLNNTIYYTVEGITGVRSATNISSDEFGNAEFTPSPALGTLQDNKILRVTGIFNGSCTVNFTTPPQVLLSIKPSNAGWIGSTSGNWNDAANWCPSIPGTATDVTIPTGVTVYVSDNEIANARNLTLTGTAILELRNSATFNFYGVFSGTGKIDARRGIIATRRNNLNQDISGDFFVEKAISTLVLANTGGISNVTITGDTLKILSALEFGSTGADLVTSNKIVLASSDTATARVGVITGTGNVIIGNFIVERYLKSGAKWRLLSAPTNRAGQTVRNSWQENGALGSTVPGYGVLTADPRYTASNTLGFDVRGANNSVKRWNFGTQSFVAVDSTTAPMNEQGYMIFVQGDRSVVFPSTTATKLRTVGTINTGTRPSIPVAANQFVIVGNPYPSRIDIRSITRPNTDTAIYVWDPSLGGAYGLGQFNTLFKDGPNYRNLLTSGIYGPAFSEANYIESGMAFMVKGSNVAGSVQFKEADKATGSMAMRLTNGDPQRLQASLKLAPQANNDAILLDGVLADFDEAYTDKIDGSDARKIGFTGETVAWKTADSALAIDRRSTPKNNDTLHLQMGMVRVRNYQWEFSLSNMDYPGMNAYLIDRYKATSTLLNRTGTTIANFNVENIAGSYAADRFKIVFKTAGVLPVNITTVTAIRKPDQTVQVQWKSEQELNLKGYEVERSTDGRTFISIATQSPNHNNGGRATYSSNDNQNLAGDQFYRIKASSLDGQIQYSTVVKVAGVKTTPGVSVHPNPVIGKRLNVRFTGMQTGPVRLVLLNAAGQPVHSSSLVIGNSNLTESIQLSNALAAGRYNLIITSATGFKSNQQVIIQ